MKNAMVRALACPEHDTAVVWRLLLLALLWSLLLVANPGFFSHDELQKVDHVLRHGFADYVRLHVRLYQGAEFGQPVRPVSFLVQGLVSLFLPAYPIVPHLVDVVMHGLIAVLVFFAVAQVHRSRPFAWAVALLFVCSPLATFSVGWPAALMDRLYVLFGLLAFIAAARYLQHRAGALALAGVCLASALAMLSKETAVVLPGTLGLFLVFRMPEPVNHKRLFAAFVAWSLPVAVFMGYRLTALAGSLDVPSSSTYGVSFASVRDGLLVYGVYPFLPTLAEAGTWVAKRTNTLVLAGAAHAVLVLLLWRSFSAKVALLYVLGYYAFLAPVLPISAKGAHYLYGSAVALSVALAAVLVLSAHRARWWSVLPAVALVLLASVHAVKNQRFIYDIGVCMNSAAISLEGAYLAGGRPAQMRVGIDPGAPGHVLHRLLTGREQIGTYYPVRLEVVEGAQALAAPPGYAFNAQCIVRLK